MHPLCTFTGSLEGCGVMQTVCETHWQNLGDGGPGLNGTEMAKWLKFRICEKLEDMLAIR